MTEMEKPTWTTTKSSTLASGVYARHTSFTMPAKLTLAIGMPTGLSSMLMILPGTPRHTLHLLLRELRGSDRDLAECDAAIVRGDLRVQQHLVPLRTQQ